MRKSLCGLVLLVLLARCGNPATEPCQPLPDVIETCLLSGDGGVVQTDVDASVTVVAVTQVPRGACTALDPFFSNDGGQALSVRVAGSGQEWVAHLGIPGLPAAHFVPCATLRLTAAAAFDQVHVIQTVNQTFALSSDAGVLVFASNVHRSRAPDFGASGVAAVAGGALCQDVSGPNGICHGPRRALNFSVGGQQRTIAPGTSGTAGPYTILVEDFADEEGGFCESAGQSRSAGYRN